MRKALLMACLGAMLVLGVATASASAAPVWTAGGTPLGAFEPATTTGTLKLTDEGARVTVECSGSFVGEVGAMGQDTITAVPVNNPCKVTAGMLLCGATATVVAVNTPWVTQLETVGSEVRDFFRSSGAGAPGYEVTCSGGFKTKDLCTGETSAKITPEVIPVPGAFDAKSEKGNCTVGGAGKGKIEGGGTTQNAGGNLEVLP